MHTDNPQFGVVMTLSSLFMVPALAVLSMTELDGEIEVQNSEAPVTLEAVDAGIVAGGALKVNLAAAEVDPEAGMIDLGDPFGVFEGEQERLDLSEYFMFPDGTPTVDDPEKAEMLPEFLRLVQATDRFRLRGGR